MPEQPHARLAVIGLGRMGTRHLLAAHELGIPVVGLFDQNYAMARQAADALNMSGSVVFRSADALLGNSGANALAVATTANAHFEYVISGAQAGFSHILCEKPMAVSVGQCEEMVDFCRKSNTSLSVNHGSRFTNRYAFLEEMLRSSSMGEFSSITSATGNIGLAMGVSHYVELFRLLAAARVSEVRFISDRMDETNPRGQEFTDPSGRLLATTASGQRMYIEFGPDQGHGMTSIFSSRYGQILLNDITGAGSYSQRLSTERELPLTRYGCLSTEGLFSVKIEDAMSLTARVWKALLNGGQFPTGEDGMYVVSVLAAAELSAKAGGKPVTLAQDSDRHLIFKWA